VAGGDRRRATKAPRRGLPQPRRWHPARVLGPADPHGLRRGAQRRERIMARLRRHPARRPARRAPRPRPMTGSKGSAAGDEQEQSPSSERNAEMLKVLSTAGLAAAFTVALAAAPEAAHASGNGCLVSAHAVGGFTEWLVAERGLA